MKGVVTIPMLWRIVIGFAVGLLLSIFFIFPADMLSLKLVEMTMGNFLRVLGGFAVIIMAPVIGFFIGAFIDKF
jgi:hypothetical protein